MPPGLATVVVFAILAGCWAVVRVTKYVFGGSERSAASPSPELTASELKALIRRSVEESVAKEIAPLHDKIERLERRLDAPSDEPSSEGARRLQEKDYGLIDEWPEEDLADADATTTRQEHRA